MSDRIFIDTNILVYLYSEDETRKRDIAMNSIVQNETLISTQVINELSNVLFKKFRCDVETVENVITEIVNACVIEIISLNTISEALKLKSRYQLSYFDSLIVASAIECKCTRLLTEDLQNGQKIDEDLLITNPFSPYHK